MKTTATTSPLAILSDDLPSTPVGIIPDATANTADPAPVRNDALVSIRAAIEGAAPAIPSASVPVEARPCYRVFDVPTLLEESGQKLRPGVYFHSMTKPTQHEPSRPIETRICGPLHMEAQTADAAGNAYGRFLRFQTTRRQWRTWAMPMHLLKADGAELRGELLDMGLEIDPQQRALLTQYLQSRTPQRLMQCTTSVGWCGDAFVFPAEVIGPGADDVVFQHEARIGDECSVSGTLDDWRAEIAAHAEGNPLLMLALSVAFAGPLLMPCHGESGGLHIIGDSSCGKTTIQKAAVSVWGSPEYRRSWRATANGLEGVAALHNDGMLALDEISECDPREVGAVVYMLGNGQGKQRAGRTGAARGVTRWRCVLLSTGERTIGATMAEGGHRQKAGQSVRLLDVPADRPHGAFDDLRDFASGAALADHLQTTVTKQYGHPIRAFIDALSRDPPDYTAELAEIRSDIRFCPEDADAQEIRAAARFAQFALAGELATAYGLTGWTKGAALDAATEGLAAWRKLRGSGRTEHRQIIEAVADFIDRHGDSRFSQVGCDARVNDRAGWFENTASGRVYLFTAAGLRQALTGFDFKRALNVLQGAGALPAPNASGERAQLQRIAGKPMKVYPITYAKLTEGAP